MVMIDLSAAFDTVNHSILLQRLSERYGITGDAHLWLQSYLSERKQFITIKGERSQVVSKTCDVPQGSVLGPTLYEDYTSVPVGEICRKHQVLYHIYADDKQIYLPFLPENMESALARLEECVMDIRKWMATNWLQFNDSKTEFFPSLPNATIKIGECSISADTESWSMFG